MITELRALPDLPKHITWYVTDKDTKRRIRKTFHPSEPTSGILLGIWQAGVYYLNPRFDYGRSICDHAIEKAKEQYPPQVIDDKVVMVSRMKSNV